jgi:hypothetical protein
MQAWRGKDRQETSNFKPMIFSEFHAAGDRPRRPRAGSLVSHRTLTAAMIDSRDFLVARRRADIDRSSYESPRPGISVYTQFLSWMKSDL